MLTDSLKTELASRFGVPSLRHHQVAGIEAAVSGMDVLQVVPTAGGKSLAFWGAGILRGGVVLVLAPLLSLMKDQVRRLTELSMPVIEWNSTVGDKAKDEIIDKLYDGWQGYFYTTPESLASRKLWPALKHRVTVAVIDEAHVCQRDRSYRPKYGKVGALLDKVKPQSRWCCTATLPERDRDELIEIVGLDQPYITQAPVARSNLRLCQAERSVPALQEILERYRGQAGIVFCATVKLAESIWAELDSYGWPVTLYHGRMKKRERQESQEAFMDGEKPIAVVTDAFLLGIDKSDLRFTIHYDPAATIEAWVQGFGRAGRDELPATCYVCSIGAEDGNRSRRFLIDSSFPTVPQCRSMWLHLIQSPSGFRDDAQAVMGEKLFGREGKWLGPSTISVLERFGLCEPEPHPNDARRRLYRGVGDFNARDWSDYALERTDARSRFDQLIDLTSGPETAMADGVDRYFGVGEQACSPTPF